MDFKLVISFAPSSPHIMILTFSRNQWEQLLAEAELWSYKFGSEDFGTLAINQATAGKVKAVRVTTKDRAGIIEELKRGYGNILMIRPTGENNGKNS